MIVTDQQYAPVFLSWLDERIPGVSQIEGTIRTLAYCDDETAEILTVCALSRWTPHTCEATLASNGAKRAKASRDYIWTIFDYVFNHAEKSRLYTFVGVENEKSIAIQHMLGLKQEAVVRDHFGEGNDALLFGITKSDWLAGPWAARENTSVVDK